MPRILLLIILIWILYVVIKRFIAKTSNHSPTKDSAKTEKIVACSQCGLHVPESESHLIDNVVYCNNPACNKQG